MNTAEKLIPPQQEGTASNTVSEVVFSTSKDANVFYTQIKNRLLNVNQWHEISGIATAKFQLTDEKGNEVSRLAKINDHLKIDIPGPGTITGEGYDWVQIESIEETESSVAFRVRAATNPTNERKDVAHFFTDAATSTFIITQQGNKVSAGVFGRNEKPNTDTEKLLDTLRNSAVATGAITAFSKLQWKSLTDGLLNKE